MLGLVKAQQVKKTVIVPVGAKGGFVPKRLPPPSNRDAFMAEGTEAYRIFVRSMLELTDNLDGDVIVPPDSTVRHDGDDPYLVVAADKGTATFSDIANAISTEKNHWLGDAFASGGSQGYDHKKTGITARAAWGAGKRPVGPGQAASHAVRGDDGDPESARRPSLVWRHRQLYPRVGGKRRSGRRSRQRSDPRHGR